ncbi:MAG: protein-L-isoaspartate(D-aspartate) O-methyltransferase [Methanomassiliicoccales archaeon]|jgi:protein-L-isoaspartate(D-aspartate) O-methyltransferase
MEHAAARKRLVRRLVDEGVISDPRVIAALEAVERHLFVPTEIEEQAYYDTPLYIGEGQTISAPHMVGIMAQALGLRPGLKVLEVGGGSGYHAAVMAELVKPNGRVVSVELIEVLAARARENLRRSGHAGLVEVVTGDGSVGYPPEAPFDRISVAAAAPAVPKPLKEQLADRGRLLVPVGSRWGQELIRVTRSGEGLQEENLGPCVFVPLLGKYGFKD